MALRAQDAPSEDDSFAQFSADEDVGDEENTPRKSRSTALADEDSDEAELERLVLGGRASFREALFRDDFTASSNALVPIEGEGEKEDARGGLRGLEDSALFVLDTSRSSAPEKPAISVHEDQEPGTNAPVWEDSDDERLTVSLAGVAQRRKLRIAEGEDLVSGAEYSRRLRQQYLRLYPAPKWADEAQGKHSKQRRRSSASGSSSGSEWDEDAGFGSALPLEKFLRDVNSFSGHESRKRKRLRPETINIQRTRDIPDQHKAAISNLHFHPQFPILLSSSMSSVMHLHHFAPTAHPTPNPMLTSVQAKGTPIRRAQFLHPHGDEIVFAGRRRYFHSWNLASGEVKKVSRILGHAKEHKTMERFRLSPCGRHIALIATDRKGGGMLNILSMGSMQWVAQARLDSRGGIADFAWWSNGEGLTMLGRDGRVAEWSLSTRRTVGTWRDPGSIGGTVMALGGRNGPPGLGGDGWVALGSTSGILTIYDRHELIVSSDGDHQPHLKPLPQARRTFEQLTTPITFVTFSADAQLMAFGSQNKKDALKLVHLPSCAVYSNWPTVQTPLGRITAVAFSAHSDVLAVGNDKGKTRLWEIRA